MGIATKVLGLIASLSFLILTHELGHFTFAKIFKTRVDQFYMFFNPGFAILRMKKFDGKLHFSFFSGKAPKEWAEHPEHTEWGLGWLPLGGYCAINGMVDETTKATDLDEEIHPWEFRAKPAWQRFFIIIGGVLVNFISAIIIYIAICFTWGREYIPMENVRYGMEFSKEMQDAGFQNGDKILLVDTVKPQTINDFMNNLLLEDVKTVTVDRGGEKVVLNISKNLPRKLVGASSKDNTFCNYRIPFVIDSVLADSPAQKAGLQRGDSLVGVGDSAVFGFFDYKRIFTQNKNKELAISFYRGDSLYTTKVALDSLGNIGVGYKQPYQYFGTVQEDYGFFQSIPKGVKMGVQTLGDYIKQFKIVFTKEGATQLGSFLTIGSIFPDVWDWARFWNMTALLGIILAFMNIIPIPGLDGGYILFILVEMVTGRKPSDKFLGIANTIGFAFLILLMAYALGLDFWRFFIK
ncbi:MAG: RIP metalloprotease RseP [Bacteroidales bacterium]|nr:RIP metalloprotease RseP [Bacteroidales bacterium]